MLSVHGVTAGYGKVIIIRGIDIEVNKGEIVAIIGRNGVGKSTFMKTIMGHIKARTGTIEFMGRDITKTKSYDRARMGMGYAPQGHGAFPRLSVEENLKMGMTINVEEKNKDLEIAYDYFPRLRERKKQMAGTLSGGEQAMLSIGRVLVGRPHLILLDELSEGIQPNVVHQIGEIALKAARELGITILFNEQHMGLIQQIADRSYAIDKGVVIVNLSGEQLKDYALVQKYLTV